MNKVSEAIVKIPAEGGEMSAFLAIPSEGRGKPVVMLQEIFGVNEAMRSKAHRFAREGFTVLVPDLFWRIQPNVELGYDEAARAEAFKFFKAFDFAKGVNDIKAAFGFLLRRPESVGAPSFVGFCLGGKLAVLAGAAEPRASSVTAFYGVALDQNTEQLKAMKMPIALHFGTNDAHIPNETSSTIASVLKESANANVYLYQGAQHGFFNQMRTDVFDRDAAHSAFERTVKVLRQ